MILEPEKFYLLTAAESVRVPPEYAVDMTAYDPSSGELRTDYAGFFDPGSGTGSGARFKVQGVKPVMEVRAHDVPFMMVLGQKVCTLTYQRMVAPPEKLRGPEIGSTYQGEGLTLSSHFLTESNHWQLPLFEGPSIP